LAAGFAWFNLWLNLDFRHDLLGPVFMLSDTLGILVFWGVAIYPVFINSLSMFLELFDGEVRREGDIQSGINVTDSARRKQERGKQAVEIMRKIETDLFSREDIEGLGEMEPMTFDPRADRADIDAARHLAELRDNIPALTISRLGGSYRVVSNGDFNEPTILPEVIETYRSILQQILNADRKAAEFMAKNYQVFLGYDAMSDFQRVLTHRKYESRDVHDPGRFIKEYINDMVKLGRRSGQKDERDTAKRFSLYRKFKLEHLRRTDPYSKQVLLADESGEIRDVVVVNDKMRHDPDHPAWHDPQVMLLDNQAFKIMSWRRRGPSVPGEKIVFARWRGRTFMFYTSRSHTAKGTKVHQWRNCDLVSVPLRWFAKSSPENVDDLPGRLKIMLDGAAYSGEMDFTEIDSDSFYRLMGKWDPKIGLDHGINQALVGDLTYERLTPLRQVQDEYDEPETETVEWDTDETLDPETETVEWDTDETLDPETETTEMYSAETLDPNLEDTQDTYDPEEIISEKPFGAEGTGDEEARITTTMDFSRRPAKNNRVAIDLNDVLRRARELLEDEYSGMVRFEIDGKLDDPQTPQAMVYSLDHSATEEEAKQKATENALSIIRMTLANALYFRDEIILSTSIDENGFSVMSIKDKGPGISRRRLQEIKKEAIGAIEKGKMSKRTIEEIENMEGDDLLELIFEPHVTSKSDKKMFPLLGRMESDGRGLGLAIVKDIMERSRGNIKVETVEEEGTLFSFSFEPSSVAASGGTETIALDDKEIKNIENRMRRTFIQARRILKGTGTGDGIEKYLMFNSDIPIDVVVDLSLIPEVDLEAVTATWSYIILHSRDISNVNFIFRNLYSREDLDKQAVSLGLDASLGLGASENAVISALRDNIKRTSIRMGLGEDLSGIISDRINAPSRPGSVEVIICPSAWLKWIDTRGTEQKLEAHQYPVAMEQVPSRHGAGASLNDHHSAFIIGLITSAMVIADRKGELKELIDGSRLLDNMNTLYRDLFPGSRVPITVDTLRSIVSSSSAARIRLAIELARRPW
jgi:hypothetical protein